MTKTETLTAKDLRTRGIFAPEGTTAVSQDDDSLVVTRPGGTTQRLVQSRWNRRWIDENADPFADEF